MATWYYYDEKGDKIEVSGGRLKGLAKAGLITPETIVENEDGKKARAGKVKGLTFPELSVETALLPDDEKSVVPVATEETYGVKLPPAKPSPFTAPMPESVDVSATDMSATANPFTASMPVAAITAVPPVRMEPLENQVTDFPPESANPFNAPVPVVAKSAEFLSTPASPTAIPADNPFSASMPVSANPFTVAPSQPFTQPTQAPPPSANVFCTNCGNPVSEQAIACMSCGMKPIGHKKFCRQCGVAINPQQVICTKCGSAIGATGTTQSEGAGEIIHAGMASHRRWWVILVDGGRLTLTPDELIFTPNVISLSMKTVAIPLEQCVNIKACKTFHIIPNGLQVETVSGKKEYFIVFGQQTWVEKIQQTISLKRR